MKTINGGFQSNLNKILNGGSDHENENATLLSLSSSINDYTVQNLNTFLKTKDEILKHPDIYDFDQTETITGFEKNLKYFRFLV